MGAAELAKAQVEGLKLMMKNESFKQNFFQFIEIKKGKGMYIQCIQKLEKVRKRIVRDALRQGNKDNVEQITLLAFSASSSRDLEQEDEAIRGINLTALMDENAAIQEAIELLEEMKLKQSSRHRHHPSRTQVVHAPPDAIWLNRIIAIQEKLFTCLFDDFEEFLDSDEVKTIRNSYSSSYSASFSSNAADETNELFRRQESNVNRISLQASKANLLTPVRISSTSNKEQYSVPLL